MVALLLVGFNGFKLMSFFNPELTGQSRTVKEAMKKWRQLENKVPATIVEALDNINLNVAFAEYSKDTPVSHKQKKKVSTPRSGGAKEKAINVKLPSLTGILSTTDAHGNTRSLKEPLIKSGSNLSAIQQMAKHASRILSILPSFM